MSDWQIIEEVKGNASIRVIGVGGGGGNAVALKALSSFLSILISKL